MGNRTINNCIAVIIGFLIGLSVGGVSLNTHNPSPSVTINEIHYHSHPKQVNVHINSEDSPFVDTHWAPKDLAKEKKCLALNMYFEARNQNTKDNIAVGLVTINRVISSYYPNTICGVVWQRTTNPVTGKKVAQFSWTLDGKSDKPKNKRAWLRAKRIAGAMLGGGSLFSFKDFTKGATHYHADYVNPFWSNTDRMKRTGHFGNHIFYRDQNVAGR